MNVVGSYSLLYNGSLMAEDGLGYVLGIDGIINVTGNSPLCFRPIDGLPKANMFLVWKRHHIFSRVAEKFLEEFQLSAAHESAERR